jgi:hypothetical protein
MEGEASFRDQPPLGTGFETGRFISLLFCFQNRSLEIVVKAI